MSVIRSRCVVVVVSLVTWAACDVTTGQAQPIWIYHGSDRACAFEFLKPSLEPTGYRREYSFFTTASFLSGRYRFGKVVAVAELPMAHFNYDRRDYPKNAIGNPYLGLEFRAGENFWVEGGVRVPIAPDRNNATSVGGRIDIVDRYEAFLTDYAPGVLAFRAGRIDNPGFSVFARLGASFLYPIADGPTFESFLLYSAQLGYWAKRVSISGGVSGRASLTSRYGDAAERTIHQAVASVGVSIGWINPLLNFRLPLDTDLKESLNWVLGANLVLSLP